MGGLRRARALVAGLVVVMLAAATPATAATTPHRASLDVAPRVQWNANFGYCGETSLVMAGMAFGQYTSQWTARSLASPGVPQTDSSSQLLLASNDLRAARAMHLDAVRAPSTTRYERFTTWIRGQVARDHVVILGMLNNTWELGEDAPGDAAYDHIVPVIGYRSTTPITVDSAARPTDLLTISDNGLRTIGTRAPMRFTYPLDDLRRSRAAASAPGGPTYSLTERGPWFGMSVTGPRDPQGVLWPVRLAVAPRGEGRQDAAVMSRAPTPRPISITVTVVRPPDGGGGLLYMYDDFAVVPDSDLNARSGQAAATWEVPSGSGPVTFTVGAMSGDTRVFRAVAATAP